MGLDIYLKRVYLLVGIFSDQGDKNERDRRWRDTVIYVLVDLEFHCFELSRYLIKVN